MKSLYERAPWSRGNLPAVAGAVLVLLSVIAPWFYSENHMARRYVSGGEIALNIFSGAEPIPVIASLSVFAVGAVALYVLLSKSAVLARLFALSAAAFFLVSIVLLPVPLSQVWAGAWTACAGLALIALSPRQHG
ncbi:MAG: hypothetical protein EPN93_04010 [Spirochaetes bacterium]|nr:MAG: hypothetical protein EPN93_04010 [Spirochaetota bacterium]